MSSQPAPDHPSTLAAIRERFIDGKLLNDDAELVGSTLNTETLEPSNGGDAVIPADAHVVAVTPDGTNTVDLDNVAEEGYVVHVVHDAGGASTPTIAYDDADFVGSGPSDNTTAGTSDTVINIDGTTTGWVTA